MSRFRPPPYSPYADFVATRDFTLYGVEVKRGDPIDKSRLSERQLRLLFDARKIVPAGFEGQPPAFAARPAPNARALIEQAEREAAGADAGAGAGEAAEAAPAARQPKSKPKSGPRSEAARKSA